MYQETLQFYHLWRLAVQERDEAREHLIHSLAELSQLRELLKTVSLSEEQTKPLYYSETKEETTVHKNWSYDHFSIAILMCDSDCYSFPSNQLGFIAENRIDFETYVLEIIGGVLPENGKFLQAVGEAGSLVDSLFITGLVPKWRNLPVQLSSQSP
ncbi:hypothetical protein EUTSA_v10015775mg, partial [Eutrema salsugineum]